MNVALLIAAVCSLISYTPRATVPTDSSQLSGDYVETRTASVFAGPCHYNGEVMNTGRDAMMAWKFDSGVRVMAVVSCDANLADQTAARKSEIVIDKSAGEVQAQAALNSILSHDKSMLGKVVSIREGKINFSHVGREYQVECAGLGSMDVQGMPNDECCKQPNLVWYEPLVKLTGRKVGYTVDAEFSGGKVADSWQREDENGAFYGAFAY